MTLDEKLRLVLLTITAMAAATTAYATIRALRFHRRTALINAPTIDDPILRISAKAGIPHEVKFKVSDDHGGAWSILSVAARPFWRTLISKIGRQLPSDEYGNAPGYTAAAWVRKIHYDPSVHSSTLLLQFDCHDVVELIFELHLKASLKTISRCEVRIRIRD